MYVLLLAMLLGRIETVETKPEAAVERRNIDCGQALARVIVVADGNAGWQGAAANGVVEELKAGLDSCHELRVARFDAEPQLHFGFTVEGDNRDLIEVRPHTPMAEVMEWAFNFLMDTPRPRTMVVIAHEQFYPSMVSPARLLGLARRSETTIHTIHLTAPKEHIRLFPRLGRAIRNGAGRLFDAFVVEDELSYSAVETARMLKEIADATGGKACVTDRERTGIDCAQSITAEILSPEPEPARRTAAE